MRYIILLAFHFFVRVCLVSQNIPNDRLVDWSNSGAKIHEPQLKKSILSFGAVSDGITDCSLAFQAAINSFSKKAAILYLPKGKYYLSTPIYLEDSVILRGEHADSTTLIFNLKNNAHCISASGKVDTTSTFLLATANKGVRFFRANHESKIKAGDYIKLYENEAGRIYSDWANHCIGQILQIKNIRNDTIFIEDALRMDFTLNNLARYHRIFPKKAIGIECLSLIRKDSTSAQTHNIYFSFTVNSWVKGISSTYSNFAHVVIENSNYNTISDSYFTRGYGYGGGGRAYGTVLQYTSGNNLIFNNIYEHLRHSVLLQAGVNGNVISFNFSFDPFWEEALYPSDFAGDLVCHGNFVYANLFEGNICNKISIDNSHGTNGPYNTFFRNRAEKYGIYINLGAGNGMNLIANEIPHNSGIISTFGSDHFLYGNVLKGKITPTGTNLVNISSLYLKEKPNCYFTEEDLEIIGHSNSSNFRINKAKERESKGVHAFCNNCQIFSNSNLDISGNTEVCKSKPQQFQVQFLPCTAYNWTSDNDSIQIQSGSNQCMVNSSSIGIKNLKVQLLTKENMRDCSINLSKEIQIKECTSLDDFSNYSFDEVNQIVFNTNGFQIEIYNISGQQIFSKKIEFNSFNLINLDLPSGIYFIKLTNNKSHSRTIKMIRN